MSLLVLSIGNLGKWGVTYGNTGQLKDSFINDRSKSSMGNGKKKKRMHIWSHNLQPTFYLLHTDPARPNAAVGRLSGDHLTRTPSVKKPEQLHFHEHRSGCYCTVLLIWLPMCFVIHYSNLWPRRKNKQTNKNQSVEAKGNLLKLLLTSDGDSGGSLLGGHRAEIT